MSDGLERDLREAVGGEVRFDAGTRAAYAHDASNYRQAPIGVVVPRSVDDVVAAVEVARTHRAPVLPRGCGTSLAGQCCNVAVVIDCSKYLREVLGVDLERRLARVQPGCVRDDLCDPLETEHQVTFAPDTSTHTHATLGGMVGNNSCGVHSVMAGRTADNVHELEVLTYDGLRLRVGATGEEELEAIVAAGGRRGEIYARLRDLRDRYAELVRARYPDIPRRVSGYNLDELLPEKGFNVARALVGTEGTCATVLDATLCLVPRPKQRSLLVLGYESLGDLGDHIPEILAAQPMACEGIDRELFRLEQEMHINPDALEHMPDGNAWVLVEFGAETKEEADERARKLEARLRTDAQPPKGSATTGPSSRKRRTSSWDTAGRSPASTATGNSGPSSSRRCSVPSSCRPSASSSGSGTPTGR